MRRSLLLIPVTLALVAGCAQQQARGGFTPAPSAAAQPTAQGLGAAGSAQPAASGRPVAPASAPATGQGAALVLRVGAGTPADSLVSVDATSGRLLARMPVGASDRRWTTVFATSETQGVTTLRGLDARTGSELGHMDLAGSWALPTVVPGSLPDGVAATAGQLVLVDRVPSQGVSRFAVLDTTFASKPRIVTLNGQFDFDAIGSDAHYLFLIEHIGGAGSGHYQVRAYDVVAGALVNGAIVDKREIDEQMEGRPVARASTSDGQWTFTVYVREDGTAFVHQLDTAQVLALCVDLPKSVKAVSGADADAWQIAVAGVSGGVVANGSLRFMATIGMGDVAKTTRLTATSIQGLAAGSPGRTYVLEPNVLTVFDNALNVVGHGQSGGAQELALSPAGDAVLLLSSGGRINRLRVGDALTPDGGFALDPGIDWSGATIVGMTGT